MLMQACSVWRIPVRTLMDVSSLLLVLLHLILVRCHCTHTKHTNIRYNTIQCNTIQYNTIRYDTIQYDTSAHLSPYALHKYSNNNFLYFSLLFTPHTHTHTHTHTNSISDGKHTVFGQVLDDASMLTVRKCEAVPVNGSVPRLPLTITQCGEL